MPHYIVTRKLDQVEVSRYSAGQVSLLDRWPLATHDHTEFDPDTGPVSDPPPMRITQFAFRSRFTQAEKITIELASLDVPNGSAEARAAAAQLRVWLADINAAQFVDLALQATVDGVQALEDYGLIAIGRADTILTTAPTADEVWNG